MTLGTIKTLIERKAREKARGKIKTTRATGGYEKGMLKKFQGNRYQIQISKIIARGLHPSVIETRLKNGIKITGSTSGSKGEMLSFSDGTIAVAWKTPLGHKQAIVSGPTNSKQNRELFKKIGLPTL